MKLEIVNQRRLTQGGFGDVYLGLRKDNREQVVVKYLRDANDHAKRAFSREIRVLKRGHEGLVQILDFDLDATHPYYVMPYCQAGTLTRYAGGLAPAQLKAVAVQLAKTLTSVHGAGDAHGDIKPDNILVKKNGELQVADPLGSGSLVTMLWSPNSGGTPGYCAPEVRAGGRISATADVYSFGATVFHLATGLRPANGTNFAQELRRRPVAPEIREVIVSACCAEPDQRPSMSDMLRLLAGEKWEPIHTQRLLIKEQIQFGLFVVLLIFGVSALAAKAKST